MPTKNIIKKRIKIIINQRNIFFKKVLKFEFLFKKLGKIKIKTPIKKIIETILVPTTSHLYKIFFYLT